MVSRYCNTVGGWAGGQQPARPGTFAILATGLAWDTSRLRLTTATQTGSATRRSGRDGLVRNCCITRESQLKPRVLDGRPRCSQWEGSPGPASPVSNKQWPECVDRALNTAVIIEGREHRSSPTFTSCSCLCFSMIPRFCVAENWGQQFRNQYSIFISNSTLFPKAHRGGKKRLWGK